MSLLFSLPTFAANTYNKVTVSSSNTNQHVVSLLTGGSHARRWSDHFAL